MFVLLVVNIVLTSALLAAVITVYIHRKDFAPTILPRDWSSEAPLAPDPGVPTQHIGSVKLPEEYSPVPPRATTVLPPSFLWDRVLEEGQELYKYKSLGLNTGQWQAMRSLDETTKKRRIPGKINLERDTEAQGPITLL